MPWICVQALAACKDLLTLWKDADPHIPVLKEAKAEYAKLQQSTGSISLHVLLRLDCGDCLRHQASEYGLCPLQGSVTRQRDVKGLRNKYVLSLT